jgi:uncharacterized circularly permuted ATP-grasp superfamily protein
VILSTHPTVAGGALAPRHVDLRAFVLFDGTEAHVAPSGLSRFAPRRGELVVNSGQGGGAKDTWVLPWPAPPSGRTNARVRSSKPRCR